MNIIILLMSEATQTALIVGGFGLTATIVASLTQIILSRRRSDQVVATVDKVTENVGVLAKNIDGAMTEIKETIAAKSLAEGQLKGIAGEQDRVADLADPRSERHAVDAVAEDIAENGKKSK